MKRTILDCDVDWEMTWDGLHEDGTRRYPDKPEKEMMFEEGPALALMLINDVIFLNDHWWKKDWDEKARGLTGLYVNCNDVFAWACADGEELLYNEIEDLYRHFVKDPTWGAAVWCMKKRNQLPQLSVYKIIMKAGIWDLDNMELGPNTQDAEVQAQFAAVRNDMNIIKQASASLTTFDKLKDSVSHLLRG